jgi:hypothetical protein
VTVTIAIDLGRLVIALGALAVIVAVMFSFRRALSAVAAASAALAAELARHLHR